MPLPSGSCLLTDLSSPAVAEHIARDSRLVIPIGSCDQYGPHLPIGAGTLVAERIAADLATEFNVLRAPTLPYGVNVPAVNHVFAGPAGVNEKSLHRVLNDLLASWESQGFTEFIFITAHRFDPHIDAIAAVASTGARIRAVEVLGIELSSLVEGLGGHEHGGEVLTSLILHLYPERVNLDLARDFRACKPSQVRKKRISRLPEASPGSIGEPTLASAEKGRSIYEHILDRIRTKVFLTDIDPTA
jgi:creatinine amidohydrolase